MIPVVSDVNTGKIYIAPANGSVSFAHQVSSGSNRMLLVALTFNEYNCVGTTGAVAASVDWNGAALTFLDSQEVVGNGQRVEWWYLLSPATGIGNINVNLTATYPSGYTVVAGAMTFSFVSQTLPFSPRVKTYSGGLYSDGDAVVIIPSTTSQLIVATVSARQYHDLAAQPPITQLYADTMIPPSGAGGGGGTNQGATGTIPGTGSNVTFNWADIIPNPIDSEWSIMGAPINFETAAALKAPENVHAIQRENYTLLWWDPVYQDVAGGLVTVTSYRIFRSSLLNENDQELIAVITTTNPLGRVDTAFVDTSAPSPVAYRVVAVAGMVQSDLSNRSVTTYAPSSIDSKSEVIDQKLLVWDEGTWDEGLWS